MKTWSFPRAGEGINCATGRLLTSVSSSSACSTQATVPSPPHTSTRRSGTLPTYSFNAGVGDAGHRQVNARQRVEIFAGAQRFPQRLAPPPAALAVDEDEQRGPLAGLADVGRQHVRGLRDVEGSRVVVVVFGRRRRGLERDGAVERRTAGPEAGRGGRLRRGVLARARRLPSTRGRGDARGAMERHGVPPRRWRRRGRSWFAPSRRVKCRGKGGAGKPPFTVSIPLFREGRSFQRSFL